MRLVMPTNRAWTRGNRAQHVDGGPSQATSPQILNVLKKLVEILQLNQPLVARLQFQPPRSCRQD
ncbi:hypothetical protein IF2G_10916 [Cordyceps javanica]|nr:hypothetical protein IF2G_10916 [Cordyceps javanica]